MSIGLGVSSFGLKGWDFLLIFLASIFRNPCQKLRKACYLWSNIFDWPLEPMDDRFYCSPLENHKS